MEPNNCPFCGSDKVAIETMSYEHGASYESLVVCNSCHAEGPTSERTDWADSREDAIEKWNAAKR